MGMSSSGLDRRSFLKNGLLGVAGFGALTAIPRPLTAAGQQFKAPKPEAKKDGYIYRTLGKTGITLPVVSMGVMNSDNENLIRAVLDAGIVHLDTAYGYMRGRNEETIGRVLKGRPRDSYFIATKIPSESTAEPFLQKLDTSLQRLGLDHVDTLYLHGVGNRESVLADPMIKALGTAKKAGKIRFAGVSTHSHEDEVIRAAIESRFFDVVLAAYNFRKTNLIEFDKAIDEAAKAGVGIIAMKTLAGGFWDGRQRQQPIPSKPALKWALSNPNVTTAIPGMTTFDQLETNLQVVKDVVLTDEERKELRLVPQDGGLYCQGCNECLSQCPAGLPIPDLMRSYMYAAGYRNYGEAYDTVASLGVSAAPCAGCVSCSVRCRMGFDVKGRATAVASLLGSPPELFAY
jgi:predicted aldo/keto reductase-like oxidoreductase